jgi:hypothetical protein
MLYVEIIAVCSHIHTEHLNTLYGQNVEFLDVKNGGVINNGKHRALQSSALGQLYVYLNTELYRIILF